MNTQILNLNSERALSQRVTGLERSAQKMIEIADKYDHPDASDRNYSAYGRGVDLFKATNFFLAAESFSEALEYWPEDPQALFALGNCYDEMGKPRKAEHCFRTFLKLSPPEKLPDVHYNLGNSLYDQNDFEAAIELLSGLVHDWRFLFCGRGRWSFFCSHFGYYRFGCRRGDDDE